MNQMNRRHRQAGNGKSGSSKRRVLAFLLAMLLVIPVCAGRVSAVSWNLVTTPGTVSEPIFFLGADPSDNITASAVSSDPSVLTAQISYFNGHIYFVYTAHKQGTASLTVTASDGYARTYVIFVDDTTPPPQTAGTHTLPLAEGAVYEADSIFKTDAAALANVEFVFTVTSSDPSVAYAQTVDQSAGGDFIMGAAVYAVKAGKADVTIRRSGFYKDGSGPLRGEGAHVLPDFVWRYTVVVAEPPKPEGKPPVPDTAWLAGSNVPSWALDRVKDAIQNGVATDELLEDFTAETTRAEFCRAAIAFMERYTGKTAAALLAEKGVSAKTFADTADAAIGAAAALGITNGTNAEKNLFSPDNALTREQAAVMLTNTLRALAIDTAKDAAAAWTDAADISPWAAAAANTVYARGIMGGTSTTALVFAPKQLYTHAQSIVTFQNMWVHLQ